MLNDGDPAVEHSAAAGCVIVAQRTITRSKVGAVGNYSQSYCVARSAGEPSAPARIARARKRCSVHVTLCYHCKKVLSRLVWRVCGDDGMLQRLPPQQEILPLPVVLLASIRLVLSRALPP